MNNEMDFFDRWMAPLMGQPLLQRLILALLVLGFAKLLLFLLKKIVYRAEIKGLDPAARPLDTGRSPMSFPVWPFMEKR